MKATTVLTLFLITGAGAGACEPDTLPPEATCSKSQSTANLFPNAGFDKTSANWGGGGGWDGDVDADACLGSGSLRTARGVNAVGPLLPVKTGVLHHFGYLARREQSSVAVSPCTIYWCKTSTCTIPGEAVGWDETYARPAEGGAWEMSSATFFPPPGVEFARVTCGPEQGEDHFDRFYWSAVTPGF